MSNNTESRWRPNDLSYISPVLRCGNHISEEFPKKCNIDFRPMKDEFIKRQIPVYHPQQIVIQTGIRDELPAGYLVKSRVGVKSQLSMMKTECLPDEVRTRPAAGLVCSSLRPLNLF
jgi:hypothetical protein